MPDGDQSGTSSSPVVAGDDDVLELGHGPRSAAAAPTIGRWRRHLLLPTRLALAFVAGGLVAFAAVRSPLVDRPRPHQLTRTPTTSVTQSPDVAALARIQALADQAQPLTDIVRPVSTAGACTMVEAGDSPQRAITAAVRRALLGFTIRDIARTLDQYTGMCAMEVRARDAAGSVLVLDVVAPATDAVRRPPPSLRVASVEGAVATTSVTVVTQTGWTVVIGSTGRSADAPDTQLLVRLGQDPGVLW
jgi:hypothetical protein